MTFSTMDCWQKWIFLLFHLNLRRPFHSRTLKALVKHEEIFFTTSSWLKMAHLPPNQPSRHRSRGRSSRATNRSGNLASESLTANSISHSTCYSSGAQRADTLATLTEDLGSSTPNLIEDSGSSMPTTTPGLLVESTCASCTSQAGASVVSTPTSSRSVTDDLVVPSPPERRSDYLTPLNTDL